jgi:hypothetical protein
MKFTAALFALLPLVYAVALPAEVERTGPVRSTRYGRLTGKFSE